MSQRVVALDVSPRALRVVVIETTLRRTDVVKLETIPIREGQDRSELFAAARAAAGEVVDSLVVSADPRVASTRTLRFPFGDIRKVDAAVEFELENQVPYAMEDTAVTWTVTQRTPAATEVLAALMPKKAVGALLAETQAAGIEARAVVLAESGLGQLALHPEHESVAVAALGESATHVAVVKNGSLRYARTLRAGGQDIDKALSRALGLEESAAKAAKEGDPQALTALGKSPDEIPRIVGQGLSALVTGLSTTFKSLAAEDAPTRLLLTGGLSRLPGLCEFLAQKLGIPVELIDLSAVVEGLGEPRPEAPVAPDRPKSLLRRAGRKLELLKTATSTPRAVTSVPPEYGVALGMALALVRHGRNVALNFRRGVFAYQGDIQLFRGQVTRIAVGVGAVLLLAIIGSIVRFSMISAEEKRLNAAFCGATKRIVGREICDPTAALATMRQAPGSGEGVQIPTYSAGTLFEMISKAIGKDVDVTFEELEFRVDGRPGEPDRVSGKGEAASFETTEQVSVALKRDPCVQDVEVSKQRKVRDGGRVEFNIGVKVSCPAGALPGRSPQAAAAPGEPEPPPPGPEGLAGEEEIR